MTALLLLALACLAPQKLKTFASHSGQLSLEVKRDEPGAFTWTLRTPEQLLWQRTESYSVDDAFVCADGTVVAHGLRDPRSSEWKDATPLTILGRDGAVRMIERVPVRLRVGGNHGYPRPRAVLVWESLDTCAFWVVDLGADSLWTFELSSGARKGQLEPELLLAGATGKESAKLMLRGARAPGANELLLTTYTDGTRGLAALLAASGELLWFEELPKSRFCGDIGVITSSADDLHCTLDVDRIEMDSRIRGSPGRPVLVEKLELHFRRDATGVWGKE